MKVEDFNAAVNADIAALIRREMLEHKIEQAKAEVDRIAALAKGRSTDLWMANCRYTDLLAQRLKQKAEDREAAADHDVVPVPAAELKTLQDKANRLDWIQTSCKTNPDRAVLIEFLGEGHWKFTHGNPAKDIVAMINEGMQA